MTAALRGLVALGIVFAAALILGGMDRRDGVNTAQRVSVTTERKFNVKPVDRIWINDPVCPVEDEPDARVNKRVFYVEPGETRCYWKKAR